MEERKIKRGDDVIVIDFYSEKIICKTTIKSCGKKWITVNSNFGGGSNCKFDASTLCFGWGSFKLFFGTEEDFYKSVASKKNKENVFRNLEKYWHKFSDEDVNNVGEITEKYITKKNESRAAF